MKTSTTTVFYVTFLPTIILMCSVLWLITTASPLYIMLIPFVIFGSYYIAEMLGYDHVHLLEDDAQSKSVPFAKEICFCKHKFKFYIIFPFLYPFIRFAQIAFGNAKPKQKPKLLTYSREVHYE